ncbi:hypothetical protein GYMLUDRAFT_893787 [Collybiopsis luxurians FD-317 M1]|uniref:Nephrocystin 3-like N-terminal domain-containing protein n=1 Tax=Collybiopsis luxurians FD-317 M1 TaxID=944289 RepID=A0A0D0C9S1_9AGAR|nr:hypothetical protein GYMLUDRAFT_893787 [Collybiopsis luxurians FD-317 M1]
MCMSVREGNIFVRGAGLELLSENIASGAFYDSEQRYPPPNCHPGTRRRILGILKNWIEDESKTTSVHWLYGAVGVGKSAIAQTICEDFSEQQLAASFFFSRTDPARNNSRRLFLTIAHQLASLPLLRDSIDAAICSRRDIIHATLEKQFRGLIIEPCSHITRDQWKSLPRLIVIDGLDECRDIPSQQRLLSIIRQAKTDKASLPFEFLICSRPEPPIRDAFRDQGYSSILRSIEVGGRDYESHKDIAQYFREGFNEIRQKRGPSERVNMDWPGEDVIQHLVQKACGQFIYGSTVLQYVGDSRGLPTERLEIVMNLLIPGNSESPYRNLDLLYKQILSTHTEDTRELLLDVIALILSPALVGLQIPWPYHRNSCYYIENLLCLAEGKVQALLYGLHSILFIPENNYDSIMYGEAERKNHIISLKAHCPTGEP